MVQTPDSPGKRRLLLYFVLAYAVSWAIEIPLALKAQGLVQTEIPSVIHYLAAFGPFLAGVIATWKEGGSHGLKELFGRVLKWRAAIIWWLVAISPLLIFFILVIAIRLLQGFWLDLGILGRIDFLPDLGLGAMVLWLLTYGFGEETGWRGYLLPRLQRGRSRRYLTSMLPR